MVRRRRNRRRAIGARAPAPVLALPNQRWSLDFVHDQMASGRRFRVLNIVDDVTRECLAAVPDTRSEEHTSELQSLMRISYAVFCLKKKNELHIQRTTRIVNNTKTQ